MLSVGNRLFACMVDFMPLSRTLVTAGAVCLTNHWHCDNIFSRHISGHVWSDGVCERWKYFFMTEFNITPKELSCMSRLKITWISNKHYESSSPRLDKIFFIHNIGYSPSKIILVWLPILLSWTFTHSSRTKKPIGISSLWFFLLDFLKGLQIEN